MRRSLEAYERSTPKRTATRVQLCPATRREPSPVRHALGEWLRGHAIAPSVRNRRARSCRKRGPPSRQTPSTSKSRTKAPGDTRPPNKRTNAYEVSRSSQHSSANRTSYTADAAHATDRPVPYKPLARRHSVDALDIQGVLAVFDERGEAGEGRLPARLVVGTRQAHRQALMHGQHVGTPV